MNIAILGNHILISFVAWIIGMGLGGGLGYGCAIIARRILNDYKDTTLVVIKARGDI
jgi:hypothetical protein